MFIPAFTFCDAIGLHQSLRGGHLLHAQDVETPEGHAGEVLDFAFVVGGHGFSFRREYLSPPCRRPALQAVVVTFRMTAGAAGVQSVRSASLLLLRASH